MIDYYSTRRAKAEALTTRSSEPAVVNLYKHYRHCRGGGGRARVRAVALHTHELQIAAEVPRVEPRQRDAHAEASLQRARVRA